jgi:hypothetical protein
MADQEITVTLNEWEKDHMRNCNCIIESGVCAQCNSIRDRIFYQLIEGLVWADTNRDDKTSEM